MSWQAEILMEGAASGEVLRLDAPISFWGGVDQATSRITLASHPQRGLPIADTVLVLPQLIGSSSSSAILLELLHAGLAPRGMILGQRDAILPVGALVAQTMNWATLPVLLLTDPPFQTGDRLALHPDGRIERK